VEPLAIAAMLQETFGESVLGTEQPEIELIVRLEPSKVADVAQFLRDEPALLFDHLMCVTGIDYSEPRGKSGAPVKAVAAESSPQDEPAAGLLGVVYHLYSYTHGHRIAVKVLVPFENPRVPSVTHLWAGANWHEREAYDLLGIVFEGHPDLRRILLPEDWVGHPLRKEYVVQDTYRIGEEDVPISRGW
jgi:NADH-quinone oxidoreductase subunit C